MGTLPGYLHGRHIPTHLSWIVVCPSLICHSFLCQVFLPLSHFGSHLVHATNARGEEFRVTITQLLTARIEQVGLVAQYLVLTNPKTFRQGNFNGLSVIKHLISHAVGSRRTPDETESISVDPLVARKTSFAQHFGWRANHCRLMLKLQGLVPRGHRITELLDTRSERTVIL